VKEAIPQPTLPRTAVQPIAVPGFASYEELAKVPSRAPWVFRRGPLQRLFFLLLILTLFKILSSRFLGTYGNYILLVVGVVALVIILWRFFRRDPTEGVGIKLNWPLFQVRKKMKQLVGVLFLGLVFGVTSASAQKDYCFENKGLKNQDRVSLTITGSKVEGTFEVMGYEESTSAETFEFTGTKSGNIFTIKFAGTVPYERAPGTKRKPIVWTLYKTTLKIPIYGKNYNTGKYSVYSASYTKCKD
jgi:nitrate reductase NapE component